MPQSQDVATKVDLFNNAPVHHTRDGRQKAESNQYAAAGRLRQTNNVIIVVDIPVREEHIDFVKKSAQNSRSVTYRIEDRA
jgi:hypothetical protein